MANKRDRETNFNESCPNGIWIDFMFYHNAHGYVYKTTIDGVTYQIPCYCFNDLFGEEKGRKLRWANWADIRKELAPITEQLKSFIL